MKFADYEVSPLTPSMLDTYYANRTPVTQQLLTELLELDDIDDHLPSAAGTWGRGSHAHGCQRQNALENLQVPEDFPFSGSTMLTFAIGKHIHAVVQTAWHTAMHPDEDCTGKPGCPHGLAIERTVDLRPKGYDHSGHVDLFDEDGLVSEGKQAIEVKSVSDYAYNMATGNRRKVTEGPKIEHVTQAGEYAYAAGAESVRIIYISKGKHDSISEWVIPMEEVMPLVLADLEQQEDSRELVEAGMLPARWQVEHGYIDSPPEHISRTGKWGKPFFCSGCRWNDLCPTLETAPVPLSEIGVEVPV